MLRTRVIASVVMILSGYGLYFAARLFYAETLVQEGTVASVDGALRITPSRADLHERLARAVPERAIPELQKALRLNPREADWWQELAVQQELAGDAAGAEKSLLEGAKVSRYYLPRWALADFYFRHENRDGFWRWARESLAIAPGDTASIFQMAHSLAYSDQEIRKIVPSRPNVLSAFLASLETRQYNTVDMLGIVNTLLTSDELKQYTWAALGAASWLFHNGKTTDAAAVWNRLVERGAAQAPERIELQTGHSLLDGEMKYVPTPQNAVIFGWQPAGAIDGITMTPSRAGGGLLIEADGKEPDRADLLGQNLVLVLGRLYRLTAEYDIQNNGITGDGLWWEIAPVTPRASASGSPKELVPEHRMMTLHGETHRFEYVFTAPANAARLTLRLERPLGATRLEGSVHLGRVALEFAP